MKYLMAKGQPIITASNPKAQMAWGTSFLIVEKKVPLGKKGTCFKPFVILDAELAEGCTGVVTGIRCGTGTFNPGLLMYLREFLI